MEKSDGTPVFMEELDQVLFSADKEDMADILCIIRQCFNRLHPDYDLLVASIDKRKDRNEQLRNILAVSAEIDPT